MKITPEVLQHLSDLVIEESTIINEYVKNAHILGNLNLSVAIYLLDFFKKNHAKFMEMGTYPDLDVLEKLNDQCAATNEALGKNQDRLRLIAKKIINIIHDGEEPVFSDSDTLR